MIDIQLAVLWPVLAPALAAVAVLVLDIAWPPARRAHLVLVALGLLGGAVAAVPGVLQGPGPSRTALCLPDGPCLYVAGSLTSGLQLLALLSALVVLVLAWQDWAHGEGGRTAVIAALVLGATAGVVAVPAAGDLASLLVALELATLPTVALVALERRASRQPQAIDGAVALLTTSLVSFALLALGAALWVVATGTAILTGDAVATAAADPARLTLLTVAAVLALSGMAFKVSAVPFHAWTPLTYRGAPLPVTTYLATVSKVAALGGVVVVVTALSGASGTSLLAVAVLAALSMTIGNVVALLQSDTVKLLAWSTVAQGGWVLLPLATLSSRATQAAGGYLAVYAAATLLAFVVVIAVAGHRGVALGAHAGLLRSRPLLGLPMAFALLALAGLPPAVIGLVAKIVALRPVAGDGLWWLAVVAALNVAIGVAVYLRWLLVLARVPDGGATAYDVVPVSRAHAALIAGLTLLLVAGSIAPVGVF